MKPRPRIRKTVKWGGAVVSVLLVVLWAGSGWWEVRCGCARWVAGIGGGTVGCVWRRAPVSRGPLQWYSGWKRNGPRWGWWLEARTNPITTSYYVPLWLPIALVVGVALIAWRLDGIARRRAMLHLCAKCSYDRTGLAPGVVCPECGAAATVPSRTG